MHCRQDVPALSLGELHTQCCPRCGENIKVAATPTADEASLSNSPLFASPQSTNPQSPNAQAPSAQTSNVPPDATSQTRGFGTPRPPFFDAWEVDEQLRHIERMLRIVQSRCMSTESRPSAEINPREAIEQHDALRHDAFHAGPPAWHQPLAEERRKAKSNASSKHNRRPILSRLVTWSILLLGTGSFVCGGALLGWSTYSGRTELWNLGLPIAAVGQVALLVGLVLQIEALWHDNHKAVAKLNHVDEKLLALRNATTLLDASHGPVSSTFYSHLAGGANSQLLLSDLKSQIDLLAMKIAQEDR
jgi:hypothetical protein